MMIVDAIGSAATQHAVYFLVTAYLESLRHFERASGVPSGVLQLPIHGSEDVAQRLHALHHSSGGEAESIVARSELAAVLGCALERLHELLQTTDAPMAAASRTRARSDNPRSALSV